MIQKWMIENRNNAKIAKKRDHFVKWSIKDIEGKTLFEQCYFEQLYDSTYKLFCQEKNKKMEYKE